MIATTYMSPVQRGRHARYHLRRALVKCLQEATRGVPRRDRIALQRRFVGEWQDWTSRGELPALSEALLRCGLGPQIPNSRPVREPVKSLAPEPLREQTRERPTYESCIGQGDLFEPALVGI